MNPNIVTSEDLREILGAKRQANLEQCLIDNGIQFFHGRDGIWTTIQLINAAKGIGESPGFNIAV